MAWGNFGEEIIGGRTAEEKEITFTTFTIVK
jgi:hypothetical protein